MKRSAILFSVLALAVVVPAASSAMILPRWDDTRYESGGLQTLDVMVDGHAYKLNGRMDRTALGYNFNFQGIAAGMNVRMWGKMDSGPSLFYGFSATNSTNSAHTFFVPFSVATVVDNYDHALSSFSASSTDGGDDGVSATPNPGPKMHHAYINGQSVSGDLGVDIGDACMDPSGGSTSITYNFSDVSRSFAPVSTSELDVDLGFDLSSHDAFTVNGRPDLLKTGDIPTPEPNSLALMGGGLLTYLASRRRRK